MQDFFGRAQAAPERVVVFMADQGRSYTAGALAQMARQMAQWLAAQGLQAGERFAVLLENRVEILALVLAARQAGLYAAVLSTHLTADEVAYIVGDSGARLVVASDKTLPQLQGIGLPCWTVDEARPQAPSLHAALAALQGPPVDFADRPLGRDLLYSSGTTGRPKGVLKPLQPSHLRGQTDPEALGTARLMGMDEHTVYLSPAPLYHAAPLRYTMRVLELGGQAVIMERFDAETALALIERYRVTHSQWVPTMFGRMLKLPETVRQRYDLSSHRVAIHAAAPCPVDVKHAMLDWWGDILMEYYAGSEGCGTTMINSAEWRRRPGSVGRPTTGRLHIVGDDGQELPAGEIGQVYFSGGGQFSYLNDEEKTRQAINERGWITYGDIGHVDAEGYLYLSDRRADLILSGGVNLYPQEIENALMRHPDVYEVAVVGVPHPDFGEQPLAAVVLRHGAQASLDTARAIAAQAAEVLARMKLPQRVVFVDALPRLETGKLLRRKLKERFRDEPQAGFALRDS
ncbi:AMP-binding protein [Diaphorobacter sp. JS3051]|uniref:AMP-binding protein n=1 Tax=Diaphorobacter sp. JS3051 TaxID=2792224 RepID=UPI0018CB37B0|nr:AMP-binding protein [Diaphorobacter sp. JS3051]QPN29697.1 AMP-binding protein [Diaphorobacter sp. JS3051]